MRKYIVQLTSHQMVAIMRHYQHSFEYVVMFGGRTVLGLCAKDDPGVVFVTR